MRTSPPAACGWRACSTHVILAATWIDTRMKAPFSDWLEARTQRPQIPETTRLLHLIAQAGAAGIRRRDLGRAITLDRDVLDDILAAMVAAGQIEVAEVGGERGYLPLM